LFPSSSFFFFFFFSSLFFSPSFLQLRDAVCRRFTLGVELRKRCRPNPAQANSFNESQKQAETEEGNSYDYDNFPSIQYFSERLIGAKIG
jgi:hypothetical protein